MTNTVTVLAESTGFSAVNTIWVLLGAALVFFMQAGFAMVETGFTRAKNAGNIIMKNLMDFCIGTPLFWLFGFGIMFGDGKFIGAYKESLIQHMPQLLQTECLSLLSLSSRQFSVQQQQLSFPELWQKEQSSFLIVSIQQL